MATIFSAELADAQTAYLGLLAEIEKHHQKYKRVEKLVEIGASSLHAKARRATHL
jgi:hypothetical protein